MTTPPLHEHPHLGLGVVIHPSPAESAAMHACLGSGNSPEQAGAVQRQHRGEILNELIVRGDIVPL